MPEPTAPTQPIQTLPPTQPGSVPAPAPPAPAPTSPSVDWQAKAGEFEQRFKSLQASMQQAVEGHREEVIQLTGQVADLTGQRDGFNAELTALRGTHTQLSSEMAAAQQAAGLRAAELTKHQLLAAEAPHLSPYARFVSHVGADGAPLDTAGIRANIAALDQIRTGDLQATQTAFREGYIPPAAPVGTRDSLPTKEHVADMIDKTAGVPGKAEEYLKWMKIRATLPPD